MFNTANTCFYGRIPTLITMGMGHDRNTMFGRFIHNKTQLGLCIGLFSRISVRQPCPFSPTCFYEINPAICINPYHAAEGRFTDDTLFKLAQTRVGQNGFPKVGCNKNSCSNHIRPNNLHLLNHVPD